MSQSAKTRQAALRERRGIVRTLTIGLTTEESELFDQCFDRQLTDETKSQFAKSALLCGAKFRANSGNPRGEKIR